MRWGSIVSGGTLLAAIAGACGDGDSFGSPSLGGAGGTGGSGGAGAQTSTTTTSTTSTTTGTAGSGPCGAVDPGNTCLLCAEAACPDEMLACCEAAGCVAVFDCVFETGCDVDQPLDQGGCYNPEACQNQYDVAGLAVAQGQAMALHDCAEASCAVECGVTGAGGN